MLMVKLEVIKENCLLHKTKAIFNLRLIFNLEKTDAKRILNGMTYEIPDGVANYIRSGSGWYFKEL